MPVELADTMRSLKLESLTRFWIPKAALTGWQPRRWPTNGDLILTLEPKQGSDELIGRERPGEENPWKANEKKGHHRRRPGQGRGQDAEQEAPASEPADPGSQ
jgi:hypothetical protein